MRLSVKKLETMLLDVKAVFLVLLRRGESTTRDDFGEEEDLVDLKRTSTNWRRPSSEETKVCAGRHVNIANSPTTAEDFKDGHWKKTEAQRRVLPEGAARQLPWYRARSLHVTGRPDLSAAACQLATRMHEPTDFDWNRLNHLFRCVKCCPRCVLCYLWHHEESSDVKVTNMQSTRPHVSRGSGSLNHVENNNLRVQEAIRSKQMKVVKIARAKASRPHGIHELRIDRLFLTTSSEMCHAWEALDIYECHAEGEEVLVACESVGTLMRLLARTKWKCPVPRL